MQHTIDSIIKGPDTVFKTRMSGVTPTTTLEAYKLGIFPWPGEENQMVCWTSPKWRTVIKTTDFHSGKSMRQSAKVGEWTYRIDHNFPKVIRECRNAKREDGSWIYEQIHNTYLELHEQGHAHSFEAYQDGKLVGGFYGMDMGGMFSIDSCFHRVDNASKLAVGWACQWFDRKGVKYIDLQVGMQEWLHRLGASRIDREEFYSILAASNRKNRIFSYAE